MNPHTLRWLALLDVMGIPLLAASYIWRFQFTAPGVWLLFPVWLVGSFLAHRDSPQTLGWRADNLWLATRRAAPAFAILALALLATGLALHAPRQVPANLGSLRHVWNYFAFCLLQQVALQSLLNNRLLSLLSSPRGSSLLAGGIFALLHCPNPVLVPATFVGGSVMAWLFARTRNIIPLAIGQTLLGSLAWWAFPIAWHHSLRVGRGYYHF